MNDSTINYRLFGKTKLPSSLKLLVVLVAAIAMSACSEPPGGGGIGGSGKIEPVVNSGLLIGQVTAIGNLTIDGVQLSTDQTSVAINGDAGELEDVRVGMAVTVDIDNDELSAEAIEYQALVAGPVEDVAIDGSTITLLGQSVVLRQDTVLDGLTNEDIFAGEVLEISGVRSEDNTITASYVRPYVLWDNYFLAGQLSGNQSTPTEHSVAGTVIDFNAYLESKNLQSLPTALFDATVVVEMQIRTPLSDTLVASDITVLPDRNAEDYETVSIAGAVSNATEDAIFTVRSFTFQINDETVFLDSLRNPVERFAITNELKVNVTGLSLSGDLLLATEITLMQPE